MKLEQSSIKKKLMAAVSMLLVSAIMTVSTTYAWFTLSTAPEISGITTAVGANGSLEIALSPLSGDANDITSNVGDSTAVDTVKNITWGNTIDVSDSAYGLDTISLSPSQLAIEVDADGALSLSTASILETPSYGTDGRVSELVANTSTGVYSTSGFTISDSYGVRAIGVAAGLTTQQIDYRNQTAAIKTATSNTLSYASSTLNTYGDALGTMLLDASTDDSITMDDDDVAVVQGVIDGLGKSLDAAEDAVKAAVFTYLASDAMSSLSDEEYLAAKAALEAMDLETIMADTTYISSMPESITSAYNAIQAVRTKVTTAQTNLDDLGTGGSYEWSSFKEALDPLFDSDNVTINGYSTTDVKDNLGELVNGIEIKIGTGAGAFADIADIAGDYTASITMDVSYSGLDITGLKATMTTNAKDPTELASVTTAMATAGSPEGTTATTDAIISDVYGYAIDAFVRTNATESNLLLQTEATQRIYSDSDSTETMGSGSTMTFYTTDASVFPTSNVLSLMDSIQITFVDSTGDVLGIAKLDTANAVATDDGLGYTADILLCSYSADTDEDGTYTGTYTVGEFLTGDDAAVLTALTQNVATQITTIVHLDGNTVTNGDVANATTSMYGTMNLQFSSSAELVPMVDSTLYGSEIEVASTTVDG